MLAYSWGWWGGLGVAVPWPMGRGQAHPQCQECLKYRFSRRLKVSWRLMTQSNSFTKAGSETCLQTCVCCGRKAHRKFVQSPSKIVSPFKNALYLLFTSGYKFIFMNRRFSNQKDLRSTRMNTRDLRDPVAIKEVHRSLSWHTVEMHKVFQTEGKK